MALQCASSAQCGSLPVASQAGFPFAVRIGRRVFQVLGSRRSKGCGRLLRNQGLGILESLPQFETIHLGVVANHHPDQKLEWDFGQASVPSYPEVEKYVKREYWKF